MNTSHTHPLRPHPSVRPSRRRFIQIGGAVLALPWFESLVPAAELASRPKRMVNICHAFGFYGPSFFPAESETGRGYKTSEYLQLLDGMRDDFTVFSGISHPEIGGDHASESCFLTSAKHPRRPGFRNTVSMDFLAGQHVGTATRFPILSLSTDNGGLTFTQSGAGIGSMKSPSRLYEAMFLQGNAKKVAEQVERLKAGQSILDRMGDRLASLNNRLSRGDQQQLSDYTESVRAMEKQLHANEEWIHKPKPTVDEPKPQDIADKSDVIGKSKLMMDMMRLALQTDSTRVTSLFIRGMDLTPPIEGVHENHHGLSHHGRNPKKIEELKIIEKAQIAVFAEFIKSLKDTRDGDGTLLDHTQVLLGSNLGDASGHGTNNLPVILAGGGHKHGQHVAGDRQRGKNTPLCDLFVTMMQEFGMETDRFGSNASTMNHVL